MIHIKLGTDMQDKGARKSSRTRLSVWGKYVKCIHKHVFLNGRPILFYIIHKKNKWALVHVFDICFVFIITKPWNTMKLISIDIFNMGCLQEPSFTSQNLKVWNLIFFYEHERNFAIITPGQEQVIIKMPPNNVWLVPTNQEKGVSFYLL